MSDRPFRRVLNCVTGEDTIVYLTDEEIAEREAGQAALLLMVPTEVSPYQARVALLDAGLLPAVEQFIASPTCPEKARIAWEYATIINRHSVFITSIGKLLNLTEEQIDDLFRYAGNVT